eukprot:TRINITY_DN10292_c0_g1_i2.p1 TRINITY_DN10292_c0_g1~~TRINITY_DN10292_c0_g1_i2.p1  ORF type:complete len:149 (+),score=7.20 TRINITY_DN10292_c0_g1_i2:38-448(+)
MIDQDLIPPKCSPLCNFVQLQITQDHCAASANPVQPCAHIVQLCAAADNPTAMPRHHTKKGQFGAVWCISEDFGPPKYLPGCLGPLCSLCNHCATLCTHCASLCNFPPLGFPPENKKGLKGSVVREFAISYFGKPS